jgi:hypothetical protein
MLTVTVLLVISAIVAAVLDKPSYGVIALAIAVALMVMPK